MKDIADKIVDELSVRTGEPITRMDLWEMLNEEDSQPLLDDVIAVFSSTESVSKEMIYDLICDEYDDSDCECCKKTNAYDETNDIINDIGDLVDLSVPSRAIPYYLEGKKNSYNLCCIRFFIDKAVNYNQPSEPYITLTSGVCFCPSCSLDLDDEIISIIYKLTSDDSDIVYHVKYPNGHEVEINIS